MSVRLVAVHEEEFLDSQLLCWSEVPATTYLAWTGVQGTTSMRKGGKSTLRPLKRRDFHYFCRHVVFISQREINKMATKELKLRCSMTEWLGRQTWNLAIASSSPTPTRCSERDLVQLVPGSTPALRFYTFTLKRVCTFTLQRESQLVSLLPVDILSLFG